MIDPQTMRNTLRLWASGVSVVTSIHEGVQAGMTVSAFNSLSVDPGQVLVCLLKTATAAGVVRAGGRFAISILGEDAGGLSDRFAGRIPFAEGEDKFTGIETQIAVTGAPILSAAIAWLDCTVKEIHDGTTHDIVIGTVEAAGYHENALPLVYFDRAYRALDMGDGA